MGSGRWPTEKEGGEGRGKAGDDDRRPRPLIRDTLIPFWVKRFPFSAIIHCIELILMIRSEMKMFVRMKEREGDEDKS